MANNYILIGGNSGIQDSIDDNSTNIVANEQGHYSLLSGLYFGGDATSSTISSEETGVWRDIQLTVDPFGEFDFRPDEMKEASAEGHTGDGGETPIVFKLHGLTEQGSASLRVSMTFEPDEDEGRLDSRLLFTRRAGSNPSEPFSIEANHVSMQSGADILYPNTPDVQFFIGNTIHTNAIGEAGTVQFQIKSDVPGTVFINEMALFIQV